MERLAVIIRFPTGFYSTVLPQEPGDSTSVTFTISNQDPPRATLNLSQLPEAVARANIQLISNFRRDQAGGLVYSNIKASPTTIGSVTKQFEVGQILEFNSEEIVIVGAPTPTVQIQHDTNLIDLDALGLSAEVDLMNELAATQQATLQGELANLLAEQQGLQLEITETQKQLNNANKVAAAAVLVPGLEAVLDKINNQITTLIASLATKQVELAAKATLISTTTDQLRAVSQLVR